MRLRLFIFAAMLLSLVVVPSASYRDTARAQESASQTLLAMTLDAGMVPVAPAFVRLVRINLESGASSPLHTHPGPELWYVEKGEVTVLLQGPALAMPGGDPAQLQQAPQNSEFTLVVGDTLGIIAGTAMTFANRSDNPASLIAIVIVPAGEGAPAPTSYPTGDPAAEAFTGIAPVVLGDGIATSTPSGAATIALERVTLGNSVPVPGTSAPVLYSVAEGELSLNLAGGSVQLSRSASGGTPRDVQPGEALTLTKGDALFFPNGLLESARSSALADSVLFRLTITPADDAPYSPVGEAADIRITGPAAVVGSNPRQPTPTPIREIEFVEGMTVYVHTDQLNLRAAPSRDAEIVVTLVLNDALLVLGPVEKIDNIRWLPVALAADPSITGYVASEYLTDQAPG